MLRQREGRGAPSATPLPALPSRAALTPLTLPRLKGDLDNIILKALSKEPERRYQTVKQFSYGLRRFLGGLPVQARLATLRYRASKFYGRNRAVVWAAALALLSLCAGLAASVWQAAASARLYLFLMVCQAAPFLF